MSQSGYIAAALLATFVLYLAAKGRLSAYTAVLWGPTSQAVPSPGAAAAATAVKSVGTASSIGSILTPLFGESGGSIGSLLGGLF